MKAILLLLRVPIFVGIPAYAEEKTIDVPFAVHETWSQEHFRIL